MPASSSEHRRPPTTLALLDHSYDQVATIFDGFVANVTSRETTGGIRCPERKPRSLYGTIIPATRRADYSVETAFNCEQEPYMKVCMGALRNLAKGRLLRPSDETVSSISERITIGCIDYQGSTLPLGKIVAESTVAIFPEFGRHYQSLLPALEAVMSVEGVKGTGNAITQSTQLLYNRLGYGDDISEGTVLACDPMVDVFTITYPRGNETAPKAYEVWCPGSAVAQEIVTQAKLATEHLAKTPGISEAVRFSDEPPTLATVEQLVLRTVAHTIAAPPPA